eukprot:TRINITY_DN5102_c0_g2_i1.p1 TRINITY_DN5102_c0_g2~~TRINITY_DN5102_c0_g2_i1.p1  ORF type:complete len:252 (-),score=76.10 TRINITY_DN5102_c0_g2_i1:616-1371(-)
MQADDNLSSATSVPAAIVDSPAEGPVPENPSIASEAVDAPEVDSDENDDDHDEEDDEQFDEDDPVCPTCGIELAVGPDALQHIQICGFEDYVKSTNEMLALQEQTIKYHEQALEIRDAAVRSHEEKYQALATKVLQQQELIELQARQIDLTEEEVQGLKIENLSMREMLQAQLEMGSIAAKQTSALKELLRMKDELISRQEAELKPALTNTEIQAACELLCSAASVDRAALRRPRRQPIYGTHTSVLTVTK